MDSRSTRYRSLDPKAAVPPPRTRDRHNSAPSVDTRRREPHPRRPSAVSRPSDTGRRSPKSASRDAALISPERKTTARHSERHSSSGHSLEVKTTSKTSPSASKSLVNLLVVGSPHCGKTSFIKSLLGDHGTSTSTQVTVEDQSLSVHFTELSLEDVDFSSVRRIEWPRYVDGCPFPEVIDGVFCLYDVSDKETVADVPAALTSMTNIGLPCMLLASKCDITQESRQINAKFHESVRRSFANVAIAEISVKTPEGARHCLLAMLDRVLTSPRAPLRTSVLSDGSQSVTDQTVSIRDPSTKHSSSRSRSNSRLQSSKSKELLLNLSVRPAVIESADEQSEVSLAENVAPAGGKTKLRLDTSAASRSQRRPAGPHTPVSSGDYTNKLESPPEPSVAAVPETPDSYYVKSMLRPASTEHPSNRAYQTFLNMDEDPNEFSPRNEADSLGPTLPTSLLKSAQDDNKQDSGVAFPELVERLLAMPANRAESKFVPSFLCLYRAFATPRQLLVAIIDQFMKIEQSKMVHFTKVAEMLRYLSVLAQWTANYPGDFAPGPARDIAVPFVQSIEKSKIFAPAARELSNNLDTIVPDEDVDWAYAEPKSMSSAKGKGPTSSSSSLAKPGQKLLRDDSHSEDDGDSSAHGSSAVSSSSTLVKSNNTSSQSYANYTQLQNARIHAEKYKVTPQIRLSKLQWHQFMEIPVEELAQEITRIDWTMFSAIRPRDFVRHVWLATKEKRRSRSSDNISAMVRHFNHLALFVSGMVLLRDKPKHRARALERFMSLAWKVRHLNNYNSLGAIVAGITGHEVARLTATHELISPEVQKQFMRLTILMGLSKSHAAYRMAWDNSAHERIPFLPLVRQDLTMAASANPTYIGTNINWRKFEIMGEVIVGLQKSLEEPYTFPQRTSRTEDTIKLVLETKIVEDCEESADPHSELYNRSVQVEPQTGVDTKKKFDWLRR